MSEKQHPPTKHSSTKHFPPDQSEGTACVEIDYACEIPHAVEALHSRADQLEKEVRNGKAKDPEKHDSIIVDLRLMAEKLEEADPV